MKVALQCCVVVMAVFVSACQTVGMKEGETSQRIKFMNAPYKPETRWGTLSLPAHVQGRVPAVVMIHGTNGPDERYTYHTRKLLDAGIAVFAMDFKTGVFTGPKDRPSIGTYTPMTFAALRALRKQPNIDPDRIGIIGFSLGGTIAVRSTQLRSTTGHLRKGEKPFAAHVGYYPICGGLIQEYNVHVAPEKTLIGGPLFIAVGAEDTYGVGESCPKLTEKVNKIKPGHATIMVLEGVHHGFDGTANVSIYDPLAKGDRAVIRPNSAAAQKATQASTAFLLKVFKKN